MRSGSPRPALSLPMPTPPIAAAWRAPSGAAPPTARPERSAPASLRDTGGERLGRRLKRLRTLLEDAGGILALVYAVPLAILAIGVPIALLIRFGMWLVGRL